MSILGVLWLAGLYISSVSSCMGSLYGPPRVLQTIANENVIPIIRVLGHGVSLVYHKAQHIYCYEKWFPCQNNPKNLDPSLNTRKTDNQVLRDRVNRI